MNIGIINDLIHVMLLLPVATGAIIAGLLYRRTRNVVALSLAFAIVFYHVVY